MSTLPLPPSCVNGVVTASARDVSRLAWLIERGFVLAATSQQNPVVARASNGVAGAAFWPLLPAALSLQFALTLRPWARYYLSPTRDALLAVAARHGAWHVFAHATARPGTGQGRALRSIVMPALCAAADVGHTPIETTALTSALARIYQREVPGLVDVGAGFPYGRRLRRDPQDV